MRTFKDREQRAWDLTINVAAVKRVRSLANVDLCGLVDEGCKPLSKLLGDVVTFVDVLYVLCRDQAQARQVGDEDFGRMMAGDLIQEAATAFVEELFDFFPDARVRASLRTVMEKGKQLQALRLAHVQAELAAIDPEAEANRLIGGSWSGGSAASSASTPAPSPSPS